MYIAFIAFVASTIDIYRGYIRDVKLGFGGKSKAPALIAYCIFMAALFLIIAIITQINT
jgi:hypothetical protein